MKRRSGFTVVELLVVIGILAILMGIVVWGMGKFGDSQRAKVTRQRMETLKSMMEQWRLANNQRDIYYCDTNGQLCDIGRNPIAPSWLPPSSKAIYENPGRVLDAFESAGPGPGITVFGRYPIGAYRHGQQLKDSSIAATVTWDIMRRLIAVPSNATALQNLGSDAFLRSDDPVDATHPINPPILVDGWGNPILFVPGAAAPPPTPTQPPWPWQLQVHHRNEQHINTDDIKPVSVPNNRPFWASAGPDGNFDTWDDNIYSFEQ